MSRKRSFLSLILVTVATMFALWGTPTVAIAAPTYTADQIEKIEQYVPNILTLRDRMSELQRLIQIQDWIDVGQFIHGPLGEMRMDMSYLTRYLQTKDQSVARQAVRDLFSHLVNIDKAAETRNYQRAVSNYNAALGDIDKFLQLIPSQS